MITYAKDVPATAWGGNSVAKAEKVETAIVVAIGLSPEVGDAAGVVREGKRVGDAKSSTEPR